MSRGFFSSWGKGSADPSRVAGELWKAQRFRSFFPLLAFAAVSLAVKEHYPFSHYPMYSNPRDGVIRLYGIQDAGTGELLPMKSHSGLSAGKLSKKMGSEVRETVQRKRGQAEEPSGGWASDPSVRREAAQGALAYFVSLAAKRRSQQLPARVQLVEMTVWKEDGAYRETSEILAELETGGEVAVSGGSGRSGAGP